MNPNVDSFSGPRHVEGYCTGIYPKFSPASTLRISTIRSQRRHLDVALRVTPNTSVCSWACENQDRKLLTHA